MMWGECPWCGSSVGLGMGVWGFWLLVFFGLLVLVGVILLVIWAVRASSGAGSAGDRGTAVTDQALETARRRYASGEITKEQFDEMRRTLER